MPNKTFTRTVCRTGHGSKDISVLLPAGATHEEIEAAILAEAPNYAFNVHDAEYELVTAIGESDTRIPEVLRELMSKLNSIGFGRNVEISGADAVDEVSQIYEGALLALSGSRLSALVIQSVSEDAFWSNNDGWVELANATHFFDHAPDLPMSTGNDARLVYLNDVRTFT